jgi:hypothetical protein
MKVEIYLQRTSQRIVFENATNTYQKGDLFCVYLKSENTVYKYPIASLFNVKESYSATPTQD